jgi:hypothetical protein
MSGGSLVELAVFVGIVAVVLVAGLRVGMLVAPRIDRLTQPSEPSDEEPHADDD